MMIICLLLLRTLMMTIVRILLCNSIRITIFLIGTRSGENYRDPEDMWRGYDSQIIIRREITSSLYNGNGNSRSGLLGVVLPEMESKIYGGQTTCSCCGALLNLVYINNDTVKEIIEAYDNIQIHVDEQMGEGIKAEELEPIVFERFLGRRIDCETTEGKSISNSSPPICLCPTERTKRRCSILTRPRKRISATKAPSRGGSRRG